MPGDVGGGVSLLEGWRPYVWRDPARCSPERLAQLQAHDDYIAALEKFWGKPYMNHKVKRAA